MESISCAPQKFKFFQPSVKEEQRAAIKQKSSAKTVKLMHDARIDVECLKN